MRSTWVMTYESNGTFVSEFGEQLEHLRRDPLSSRGESAVDIEEANSLIDGTIFQIGVLLGRFSHNNSLSEELKHSLFKLDLTRSVI
jgi:hypothetical protein